MTLKDFVCMSTLVLCGPVAFGCAMGLKSAEREPCPPSDLAKIEAAYVREALETCRAEGATYETCKALPGIRAKYRAARAAYVECAK